MVEILALVLSFLYSFSLSCNLSFLKISLPLALIATILALILITLLQHYCFRFQGCLHFSVAIITLLILKHDPSECHLTQEFLCVIQLENK